MNDKFALYLGGIFAGLSVALGAFGAHALKAVLDSRAQGWFQTAVQYQTTHSLAILACGIILILAPGAKGFGKAAWAFTAGIMLFSGSLYLMAATGQTKLGMITPLGGAAFLLGWCFFCVSVSKIKSTSTA